MKKVLLATACAALLSGCASVWTSTDFTPYVGDDQIYIGKGGAMEVMDGVEVWKTGLPNRKYRIIGIIDAEITDGWKAMDLMMSATASEAKDHGADAIIFQSAQMKAGVPYVNVQQTNVNVTQNNTANVYANNSAVAVAQGARTSVNMGGGSFAGGLASGINQGMGIAMAMGRRSGTFLAIEYVD